MNNETKLYLKRIELIWCWLVDVIQHKVIHYIFTQH